MENRIELAIEAVVLGGISSLLSLQNHSPLPKGALPPLGWTLLHYAIEHEQIDVAEWLISLDFDVNAQDNNGWTPLLLAIDIEVQAAIGSPSSELTELLLQHGADPTIKNSEGKLAMDLATELPHDSAIDAISRNLKPAT